MKEIISKPKELFITRIKIITIPKMKFLMPMLKNEHCNMKVKILNETNKVSFKSTEQIEIQSYTQKNAFIEMELRDVVVKGDT